MRFAIDRVAHKARSVTVPLAFFLLFAPAWAGQRKPLTPRQQAKMNRQAGSRPMPLEALRNMGPEQRRRFLQNLPPARRQRLEQRLKDYEAMPPARREQLNRAYQRFTQLPPQQQNAVRQSFSTFTQLSPDRKQALRQEMRTLRSLSPEQRQKRMNGKDFENRFSANERDIMRQMTGLSTPLR